jgi:hypothetical protein
LLKGRRLADHANGQAVLGSLLIKEIGRLGAAGARHVPDDDLGISGDVARQPGGGEARIDIVGPARIVADDQTDLLVGIEAFARLGLQGGRVQRGGKQRAANDQHPRHGLFSLDIAVRLILEL